MHKFNFTGNLAEGRDLLCAKQRGTGRQRPIPRETSNVVRLLLRLHRQVMHIKMAGQTFGEHFQLFLVVRFIMALAAVRNLAVLLVAGKARDLAVFARGLLPFAVNVVVTSAARLNLGGARETDLQRGVDPHVTGHAVR